MNILYKLIFLTLLCSGYIYGSTYEYPQLYKDNKLMGMGGVNIAIGGKPSSLFYNTAGISKIPKSYGFEFDIVNANLEVNNNLLSLYQNKDYNTLKDDYFKFIDKYLGKNIYIGSTNSIISFGQKYDEYAFSLMPIVGTNINLKIHNDAGLNGLIEMNSLVYEGVAFGISKDIEHKSLFGLGSKKVSIGVGIKYIQYINLNENFSVVDLTGTSIGESFNNLLKDKIDKLKKFTDTDSDFVVDIGIIDEILDNLTIGLSIQNIGGIAKKIKTQNIPTTVGLGIGYSQRFDDRIFLNQYQIGVDYIDLTHSYNQDNDILKRTRIGLSVNIFDGWFGTFDLQTGLYQGNITYGTNFRLAMLKVGYSRYTEELGISAGQSPDQRDKIEVSIGW